MLWRFGLALTLWTGIAGAAELELVARVPMVSDHPRFGGASGIEVLDEGRFAYILSDRGRIFETNMTRHDGNLPNAPVRAAFFTWFGDDSEGLAVTEKRQIFVSYEGFPRVDRPWVYCLPSHDAFPDLFGNRALEALAITGDDTLYAVSENPRPGETDYALYRYQAGAWDVAMQIPRSDRFQPVGADIGPDGHLYLLERHLGFWGFQSQIRRIDLATNGIETLWQSARRSFENLEGLSVWADEIGQTRLTLVSDDNLMPFMRNELVEFVLTE